MNPIIVQTLNNVGILAIAILILSVVQKGFFFPYVKVRLSFGRLTLIKIRAVNRDYFKVGEIVDGFLVYKTKTGRKRHSVNNSKVFYKSLAITWVDVDEETGALQEVDYTVVSGFDSEKYDNLYKRTLYRPAQSDQKEKIMFIILVLVLIVAAASAYVGWQNLQSSADLTQVINQLKEGMVMPK